jgi:hypothetical protein
MLPEEVGAKDQLVAYLLAVAEQVRTGSITLGSVLVPVENLSTADFLEAIAYLLEAREDFIDPSSRQIPMEPSWKLVSFMLSAGLIYE